MFIRNKNLKKEKLKLPPTRVILFDDREKNRWKLTHERFRFEKVRLAVGDYTFRGFEDKVAIEKKSGWPELAIDCSSKYRNTFLRYLEKLQKYEYKIIIVEDDMQSLERKIAFGRYNPDFIMYWYTYIMCNMGIKVMPVSKLGYIKKPLITKVFESFEECLVKKYGPQS